MTPERYQRVRSVFHEVHTLSGTERAQRLDSLCAGDDDLRSQVMALIDRASDATGFLEKPALSTSPLAAISTAPDVPDKIGPYKIVEKLGGGGMGDVYLAEQAFPIKRKVALKVIREGMDSKGVVARFELERQALALMDHPNIAKVFDAGTDKGRPYFVMEYVPGMHLTEYCDRHRLNMEARLELFHDVCDAVQHAHSKGIIHRDLKPSNILVQTRDGAPPLAKIIDFGVAKATETAVAGDFSIHTMSGTPIGTWDYMSPEQAAGKVGKIDIRSDVFSLGVILYQLLTGLTPIDLTESASLSLMDVQQTIVKSEAPRPSTRLRDLGAKVADIADLRRTDIHGLTKVLRRDLDWVVMKAIEKEPLRRYQTARELADEIKRFLANEPVLAGPPTTLYKVTKFVRRNRALVAGASAVLIVLTGGLATSIALYLQASEAKAEAERQTQQAIDARAEVQTQLERVSQAERVASENAELATARAAEAERERQLQQELRRQADGLTEALGKQIDEVESRAASMAQVMSEYNAFMNAVLAQDGRVPREQLLPMMEGVLQEVLAEGGAQSSPTLTLVRLRFTEKRFTEVVSLCNDALTNTEWRDNDLAFWTYLGMANLMLGRLEDARIAFQGAIDRGDEGVHTLVFMGETHRAAGDLERAREWIARARDVATDDAWVLTYLGIIEYQRGVPSSSAGWLRRALRVDPTIPDAREFLLASLDAAARRSIAEGRLTRADDELEEACELADELLEPTYPTRARLLAMRGAVLLELSQDADAEAHLLAAVYSVPPSRRASDPSALDALAGLATLYQRQGREGEWRALAGLSAVNGAAIR